MNHSNEIKQIKIMATTLVVIACCSCETTSNPTQTNQLVSNKPSLQKLDRLTAKTSNNEIVFLYSDGTWKYSTKPKSEKPDVHQKVSDGALAYSIVKNYIEATHWKQRLNYVLYPKEIQPCMERYYQGTVLPLVDASVVSVEWNSLNQNEQAPVKVKIKNQYGQFNIIQYIIIKTSQGIKIDWEQSVEIPCNTPPLNVFKSTLSNNSTTLKLIAELDSYYNFEFINAKATHWSVSLHEGSDQLYGYVAKESKSGKYLYESLKDGRKHAVVLRLQHTEDSQGGVYIIDEVIRVGS